MSKTLVHVESSYETSSARWSTPELVDHSWVKVDGLSSALNYGQQTFDGMKACRNKDESILLFRPHEHWKRLNSSGSSMCMPNIEYSHFLDCVRHTLIINEEHIPSYKSEASVYLRLLLFGSGAKLSLLPSDSYTFCVFMQPVSSMTRDWEIKGIVIEDADVSNGDGYDLAGPGATYSRILPHMLEAKRKGFLLALHLDRDSRQYIEGFSDRSFIGFKRLGHGQYCMIVNRSGQRTPCIVLDSCVQLARKLSWKVERRKIAWSEVETFHEVLAINTPSPVVRVSCLYYESAGQKVFYKSSQGDTSSAFAILSRELLAAQRGECEEFASWNYLITSEQTDHGCDRKT